MTTPITYDYVRKIIKDFEKRLQDMKGVYVAKAEYIQNLTNLAEDNNKALKRLNDEVDRMEAVQLRLHQNLQMIGDQQRELDEALDEVERAQEEEAAQPQDIRRKELTQIADNLTVQLAELGAELKGLSARVSAAHRPGMEFGSLEDMASAIDEQLASLQWVDRTTTALQSTMTGISEKDLEEAGPSHKETE